MISEEDFEAMYADSLARLDAYIARQVTEKQIISAQHHKNTVVINHNFYTHCAKRGERMYLCKQCGKLETGNYCEPHKTQMLEDETCFHCNHWKQEAIKVDPKRLVIDGHVYGDGGNQPNAQRTDWLGFGGHLWKIERDGKVWETNNLWSGSTIPQEFVHLLPDNAKFLPRTTPTAPVAS